MLLFDTKMAPTQCSGFVAPSKRCKRRQRGAPSPWYCDEHKSQQSATQSTATLGSAVGEGNNAQGGSDERAKGRKAAASLGVQKEKRRKSTATPGQEKAGSVLQRAMPKKCVLQYEFRSCRNEPPRDY